LIANIGDAIAHDCRLALEVRHNAQLPERLHLIRSRPAFTGGGPMNDHRWSNERLVQTTTGLAAAGFRFGSRSCSGPALFRWRHMAQIIELFPEIVSSRPSDETILVRDETFCFGADIWKQRMVIKPTTKRRATPH